MCICFNIEFKYKNLSNNYKSVGEKVYIESVPSICVKQA